MTRHGELAQCYLPDDLLERIRGRADGYDRDNAFCYEDIDELAATGYLHAFVPEKLGGPGLSLNEVSHLQQRLATAAPATALGINMHFVCTGALRAMHDRGDTSMDSALAEVLDGEIFAFGISEAGNDWVLQGSTTTAEPQADGSYLLTGTKIFTSLSPVWTRLICHGLDSSNPDDPTLVYGILTRDHPDRGAGQAGSVESGNAGGSESGQAGPQPPGAGEVYNVGTWDVMGMRATHSRTTVLDGARMAPERVARRIPDGPNPDLLTFGITANFQLLVASVYAGLSTRALEVAAQTLKSRHSAKADASYAQIPEFRTRLADAAFRLMPITAQLDTYTREFDELVDHGPAWAQRFVSAKVGATDAARDAVESMMRCVGGAGFSNGKEANRLYRDALAGMFHPPSADVARQIFAAAWLDD